jgi:rhodanese-related sulfurtransferase
MRLAPLLTAALLFISPAFAAERMSPQDVAAEIAAGKAVLVDVRTPEEWAETGVATAATPIDMTSPTFMDELQKLLASNPGKRLALICRSSNRSSQLAHLLETQSGLSDLIDVAGGMLGKGADIGWIAAGLPVRAP